MAEPAIRVRDLTVRFTDTLAVDGVSFDLREGGAFGLVGESGSGKSTVLRAIAGLVDRWNGEIEVEGRALGPRRDRAFYRRVQMVFQDPYASLHPRHTVDKVLAEPLLIHGIGDAERRIVEALEAVGLGEGFRFRFPHQLSGGQRQRVAVARALMLEPPILMLDEPTSALDVSVQAEVLNLLADLRAERGLSYLLVSHDLAVVAHVCEQVAVMQNGKVVETLGTDAMRRMEASEPYTRQLLDASRTRVAAR